MEMKVRLKTKESQKSMKEKFEMKTAFQNKICVDFSLYLRSGSKKKIHIRTKKKKKKGKEAQMVYNPFPKGIRQQAGNIAFTFGVPQTLEFPKCRPLPPTERTLQQLTADHAAETARRPSTCIVPEAAYGRRVASLSRLWMTTVIDNEEFLVDSLHLSMPKAMEP